MLAKLAREVKEYDELLSNPRNRNNAPINAIFVVKRKNHCHYVKYYITQFEKAYKQLDTVSNNHEQINRQVKKHANFILAELDQLNVYYCIENIKLLTDMLVTTTQAILYPHIGQSKTLNRISDKVIGHPAPQLKKIGYCVRILLGMLAIGLGVTLGLFTLGIGYAPCMFVTIFGVISFFQGVGGLYSCRRRGLSKAITNTTHALENSRPIQPQNCRTRPSIDNGRTRPSINMIVEQPIVVANSHA